jgi:hypothetical protein
VVSAPAALSAQAPHAFITPHNTPALRSRSVLLVGCGSLGSLAAHTLAPLVGRLLLMDPAVVTAANPVRQLYRVSSIGRRKVAALRDELQLRLGSAAPAIITLPNQAGADEAAEFRLRDLVERERPDLALLLTGTGADLACARALRASGVPHLAARCYPRARYWEAIIVPDHEAPCLGCLRGQLHTGPHAPPTPEEAARYTSAGDLNAEPATRVESGWAAACVADLAVQLLAPPGLRERWFLDALAGAQTCFVGGAYALNNAYGIARPGQVRAYGLAHVLGSAATRICADCGRAWEVRYRVG